MADPSEPTLRHISQIIGGRVLAPNLDPSQLQDITIVNQHITNISPHDASRFPLHTSLPPNSLDARNGGIITPTLCHAHMHLDKAFLTSHPKYADLALEQGGFEEAMDLGRKAKERFEETDLVERGKW